MEEEKISTVEIDKAANRSEVQNIIWDIVKVIKPFLDENNIRYYIIGGTLLGALRHKGFIPWDDDFDIGVPRADYDRFVKGVSKILPEHMRVVTNDPDDGNLTHHFYFTRIVDTRYKIKRTCSMVDREEFVWVDIFPFDGLPGNWIKRKIHMMKVMCTRAMYHLSTIDKVNMKRHRTLVEKFIIKVALFTGFGVKGDMHKWIRKLDKLFTKYPFDTSEYVYNGIGPYKFREIVRHEIFGEGALYEFEGILLNGPFDARNYLRHIYGDFMRIPPESERNEHGAEPELIRTEELA